MRTLLWKVAAAGGSVHYRDRNASWSATVNKYLGEHGLRETPDHSSYGLRHSFEDRLLEAGVDDRIRAELMGHKYARPAYGKGGSLEIKREAVARIAI
jgi:integrase